MERVENLQSVPPRWSTVDKVVRIKEPQNGLAAVVRVRRAAPSTPDDGMVDVHVRLLVCPSEQHVMPAFKKDAIEAGQRDVGLGLLA